MNLLQLFSERIHNLNGTDTYAFKIQNLANNDIMASSWLLANPAFYLQRMV
jgi:hypothetical protein